MPTLEPYLGGFYLWHYIPNQPAAIVFAIFFSIATGLHGWKMFRTRMWFCLPFFIGGIFEIVGYAGRAASYNATGQLIPYLVQSIFLLLAPVLFAASLYMTYGRCVLAVGGEKHSVISPRWTTRVFVFGDIFSFLIQSSGAGIQAQKNGLEMGQHIVVGGLVFQLLMFGLFIYIVLSFNVRFRRQHAVGRAPDDVPWQSCLSMLYATSAMIVVRNTFRVVEFGMGSDSYLLQNEWPVYVFDGLLMLATMACYFVWYPSTLRSGRRDSSTQLTSVDTGYGSERQAYKP